MKSVNLVTTKLYSPFIRACLFLMIILLNMQNPIFTKTALSSPLSINLDETAFNAWVQDYLKRKYGAQPPPLVQQAFKDIQPITRVLELDRKQPEFSLSFWEYIDRVISAQRVNNGKANLKEYAPLLSKVSTNSGVPMEVLVAFWGMETSYGKNLGSFNLIPALATLAFDTRRSAFFENELDQIVNLIQQRKVLLEFAYGSWAGAMGHMQFMPSSVTHYAIDGDGDQQINLVASIPDAMFSAGNYLAKSGWRQGETWGQEILLPDNFNYNQDYSKKMALGNWQKLGLMPAASNKSFPNSQTPARLIIPAGHKGPKFLVYHNFDVILRWNRSDYYALAIGLLSDAILDPALFKSIQFAVNRPLENIRISQAIVKELQISLEQKGYNTGGIDGILGSGTRAAFRQWQRDNNFIADGYISPESLKQMGIQLPSLNGS